MANASFLNMAFIALIIIAIFLYFVDYFKSCEVAVIPGFSKRDWNPVKSGNKSTKLNPNATSVLIIYWTNVFRSPPQVNVDRESWPYFYAGNDCPINCTLTTNKSRVSEASALVVHARNPNEIPPRRYENMTWILHTNENPVYTPSLKDPSFMSKFNYLVSYRMDADFPCPSFLKPSLKKPIGFREKKGFVMVAYSNCEVVRTTYIRELMKYIKVDSYGACLHNKDGLNRVFQPDSLTRLGKLQRNYKFYLVFPNADCDYYVTEKLANALSAGSVPVWLGTDKIDEILQWGNLKHSIIKVNDFASPEKLAKYLLHLSHNEVEYNKYLKWKYEGFQFPREYYSSALGQWWDGFPLYCRVCMRVAMNPKGHDGLPVDKCDGKQQRTLGKWLKQESNVRSKEGTLVAGKGTGEQKNERRQERVG